MLPMRAERLLIGTLLAADAGSFAPAVSANKIALVMAAFTPNEDLTLGDLTLADFAGSTPLAGSTGAQLASVDPATDEQLITIKEPLGGWRWVTTALTNLPQTIYGYALVDSTIAAMYGVQALDVPITLTAVGQSIDLGAVVLRINQQPIS